MFSAVIIGSSLVLLAAKCKEILYCAFKSVRFSIVPGYKNNLYFTSGNVIWTAHLNRIN